MRVVGEVVINEYKAFNPIRLLLDNRKTPPLAKIGKSLDVVITELDDNQAAMV